MAAPEKPTLTNCKNGGISGEDLPEETVAGCVAGKGARDPVPASAEPRGTGPVGEAVSIRSLLSFPARRPASVPLDIASDALVIEVGRERWLH